MACRWRPRARPANCRPHRSAARDGHDRRASTRGRASSPSPWCSTVPCRGGIERDDAIVRRGQVHRAVDDQRRDFGLREAAAAARRLRAATEGACTGVHLDAGRCMRYTHACVSRLTFCGVMSASGEKRICPCRGHSCASRGQRRRPPRSPARRRPGQRPVQRCASVARTDDGAIAARAWRGDDRLGRMRLQPVDAGGVDLDHLRINLLAPPNSIFTSLCADHAGQATSLVAGLPVAAKASSEPIIFSHSARSSAVHARVVRMRLNASSVPNQNGRPAVWYAPTVARSCHYLHARCVRVAAREHVDVGLRLVSAPAAARSCAHCSPACLRVPPAGRRARCPPAPSPDTAPGAVSASAPYMRRAMPRYSLMLCAFINALADSSWLKLAMIGTSLISCASRIAFCVFGMK